MAIIVNTVTIAAVVVIILRRSCQVSPRIEKAYIRVHGSVHSKGVTVTNPNYDRSHPAAGWRRGCCQSVHEVGFSHLATCHMLTWLFSPGHLLTWLPGHLFILTWSPAHLVTWSPNDLVMVTCSPGYSHLLTWSPGYLVILTWFFSPGYLATRSPGHLVISH